jgi:hypothetical protein
MKTTTNILICCMVCMSSYGRTNNPDSIDIDFFGSDEPLQMTLCFDIREFVRTKSKPQNFDATLTVMVSPTDSITQRIKVKARGEMRRKYCQFPPLMLKFKKDTGKSVNLKLVTHCMRTSLNEKYVLKEYLVYRMFNQVTPYSLKTRLVKVRYVDINNPEKAFTAFGFLIENEEKLAERNESVIVINRNLTQKHMNPVDMARIAVFNFMIGNTDWSVPMQHNIRILKSIKVNSDKGIPVAYDFDYSGLVNASYSIPNEQLPIKEVTERYYQGVCYNENELKPIFDEMAGLHDDILGTIDRFELLSENDKKPVRNYIESFYKRYNNHDVLLSEFKNTCKPL